MSTWICPNRSGLSDHPDTVLFRDDPAALQASNLHFRVPKPVQCPVCGQYYLKSECKEIPG